MPHLPDANHPDHDLELVAAYAAGDATGPELERATALVTTCTQCAALHHDLRSIAAAMPELPAAARPRDFRLTPEQAASLRPAGIRGLLATLSGPRFAFATPVGTGLAALGIVGVLVASGGLPSGGSTAAPLPETAVASALDRENGAVGATLASPAPASEAAPVAPEAAGAASAGPVEEAPATSDAASAAPSAAGVALEDEASPAVDTAGGVDTSGGGASEPKSTLVAGASSSEPAPSDDSNLYLTADASPDPSRSTSQLQAPAASSPTIQAASGPIASPEAPSQWSLVAALVAVIGLALVALRWGARRLA